MEHQYTNNEVIMINNYIKNRRKKYDWNEIKTFGITSSEKLNKKIKSLVEDCVLPESITLDDWKEFVNEARNDEENGTTVTFIEDSSMISKVEDNDCIIHEGRGSAWSCYRDHLKDEGFLDSSIEEIKNSSYRILKKLKKDTHDSDPVKGLVIGNVQSGKTANMAALMAMAADEEWNMFIVLSGTIDNLREQTQGRFQRDLVSEFGNLDWELIDNPKCTKNYPQALSKLHLNGGKKRYIIVCLKNSTRLSNLIKFLNKDDENRKKLRILLIDDEADQAGVNSGKKNDDENRTKINRLIGYLMNNRNQKGEEIPCKFHSFNYIAYTATPYANVLNEKPSIDSTYPSNFVMCLKSPHSYFGPQEVFGLDGTDKDGMNILNIIPEDEMLEIDELIEGSRCQLPMQLKEAILWFYCTFAIRKHRGINKPVTMLVHVSQKQAAHQNLAEAIRTFIQSYKNDYIRFLKECNKVYDEQKRKYSLLDFQKDFPYYDGGTVLDYPTFNTFSNELIEIYKSGLRSIQIDDEDESVSYHKGVSICIDNCAHNKAINGEYLRILYPDGAGEKLEFTTGFIVIGGATLSRGLTLQGLTCSYFLRDSKYADTLMQMGRWFGYRKGYELLPRVWLSQAIKEKYQFLSLLDFELRDEMRYMADTGVSPAAVGIRVKSHPRRSYLLTTAHNKMKDAMLVKQSYSGVVAQTTVFYRTKESMRNNLDITSEFINQLGDEKVFDTNNRMSHNSHIFTNVEGVKVLDYISKLQYPVDCIDFENFKTWWNAAVNKGEMDNWNIVVAGSNTNKASIMLGKYCVTKVIRSQKSSNDENIRIGALRSIIDVYADIDRNSEEVKKLDKNLLKDLLTLSTVNYGEVREKVGLGKKGLLIIYVIDKDSKPHHANSTRVAMDSSLDLVGITIVIPRIPTKIDSLNSDYLGIPQEDFVFEGGEDDNED